MEKTINTKEFVRILLEKLEISSKDIFYTDEIQKGNLFTENLSFNVIQQIEDSVGISVSSEGKVRYFVLEFIGQFAIDTSDRISYTNETKLRLTELGGINTNNEVIYSVSDFSSETLDFEVKIA